MLSSFIQTASNGADSHSGGGGGNAWSTIKLCVSAGVTGAAVALTGRCRRTRHAGKGGQRVTLPPHSSTSLNDDEDDDEDNASPDDVGAVMPSVEQINSPKVDMIALNAAAELHEEQLRVSYAECVVVCDPVSTGANVADAFLRRGYAVVSITSSAHSAEWVSHGDLEGEHALRRDFLACLFHSTEHPARTVDALRTLPVRIIGVVSGSELGVETCDYVSESLGLPSNGTALSEARRDKALMQETVAAAGLRSIMQTRATCWADVEAFIDWQLRPTLILKPARSAGSDGVFKCSSTDQARAAFASIAGVSNALGEKNDVVVVQEFLEGKEYIVDSVSRRGKHKIVAVWEYDKRSIGEHHFIYFGQSNVSALSSPGVELASYAVQVLDALGVREGAGHAEIILTRTGPCLVELGARPQGNEGTFAPVADRVWGYSQIQALIDATVAPQAFEALPDLCGAGMTNSFKLDFVSRCEGVLLRIDHLDTMAALGSFVRFDLLPRRGDTLRKTIDCFTACGSVSLVNEDPTQLQADVQRVRELEQSMWIVEDPHDQQLEKEQHAQLQASSEPQIPEACARGMETVQEGDE